MLKGASSRNSQDVDAQLINISEQQSEPATSLRASRVHYATNLDLSAKHSQDHLLKLSMHKTVDNVHHNHADGAPCDCKEKLKVVKEELKERKNQRRKTLVGTGLLRPLTVLEAAQEDKKGENGTPY